MAEALVDVALATTIATADADISRQQTTINNNQQQARGKAVSGDGNDRVGIVAVVTASEAAAAPAAAWHCGGGQQRQ